MSSSLDIIKETKKAEPTTPTNGGSGLSLFDQLKNSKDHNSVNKVATIKTTAKISEDHIKSGEDNDKSLKKIENNININTNIEKSNITTVTTSKDTPSLTTTTKDKPEFCPPALPVNNSNLCNTIGIVQGSKRSNIHNSVNLFGLKSSSRDFAILPQSLKRSQNHHNQHVTKKTAFSSSNKTLENLWSSSILSSSIKSLNSNSTTSSLSASSASLTAALAAANLKPGSLEQSQLLHHHHQQQQQNKKKRCTDRYDSSESSDR